MIERSLLTVALFYVIIYLYKETRQCDAGLGHLYHRHL